MPSVFKYSSLDVRERAWSVGELVNRLNADDPGFASRLPTELAHRLVEALDSLTLAAKGIVTETTVERAERVLDEVASALRASPAWRPRPAK